MKRNNKATKLHPSDIASGLMWTIGIVAAFAFILSSCTSIKAEIDVNRIIKKATDNRGLTSIVFITHSNDTFALDYLTPAEWQKIYKAAKQPHTYETDDTKFYNGEILLPDYVHTDTLIVTDANFINWAMEYYDAGSDGDIADILRVGTCKYLPVIHYSITCLNDTIFNK